MAINIILSLGLWVALRNDEIRKIVQPISDWFETLWPQTDTSIMKSAA